MGERICVCHGGVFVVMNMFFILYMGYGSSKASGGTIGTWIVILHTSSSRAGVTLLALRSRAPVTVFARRIERRGYETRTWQPPKAAPGRGRGVGVVVTKADSRIYVLHCLTEMTGGSRTEGRVKRQRSGGGVAFCR